MLVESVGRPTGLVMGDGAIAVTFLVTIAVTIAVTIIVT
jgi:hypothetical protein